MSRSTKARKYTQLHIRSKQGTLPATKIEKHQGQKMFTAEKKETAGKQNGTKYELDIYIMKS